MVHHATDRRRGSFRWLADQRGQAIVEYALVLAVIGLPCVVLFGWLLGILAEYYRMVVFVETLPFP